MGISKTWTNIPHTCPLIDSVISVLDEIYRNEKDERTLRQIEGALETLEVIRKHNGSLRDELETHAENADEREAVIEILEQEKRELKSEISDLKDEVSQFDKKCSDLESENDKLNEKICELESEVAA